jgi:hypothetical protein
MEISFYFITAPKTGNAKKKIRAICRRLGRRKTMSYLTTGWSAGHMTCKPAKFGKKLFGNIGPAARTFKASAATPDGNVLLLASLAAHLNVTGFTFGDRFRRKANAQIKAGRFSSLLEIGPADGYLLRALASLSENTGLKLHALGPSCHQLPNSVRFTRGYIQDFSTLFGGEKFDLIVSSGVFCDKGFTPTGHEDLMPKAKVAINCFRTMLGALSDHPQAACIAAAYNHESLLLNREELSAIGRISFWYGLPNFATIVVMTRQRLG